MRAVRIQNTLHVAECWVSETILDELRDSSAVTVLEEGLTLMGSGDSNVSEELLAPFVSTTNSTSI